MLGSDDSGEGISGSRDWSRVSVSHAGMRKPLFAAGDRSKESAF